MFLFKIQSFMKEFLFLTNTKSISEARFFKISITIINHFTSGLLIIIDIEILQN